MNRDRRIHDGVEQTDNHRRFGWWFDRNSDRVWNPQENGTGPIIMMKDGELEDRYIQRGKRKVAEGNGGLWGRLGPVDIDGIEIRRNTKIWHDDRETWLRASEIDVSEDPEPIIRFKIDGSWPVQYIEYYGSDLEELREEGVIESEREVNDRAEEAIEKFRQRTDS